MRLRTRLTLYFTLLVTALILVRSVINYYSIYRYNEREFYNSLKERATTTAELLLHVQQVDSALLKVIDREQYDLLASQNITVYDSANHELYTNNDTVFYHTSADLFQRIRTKKKIIYQEGPHKIIGFCYPDSTGKNVVIAGAIDKDGEALLHEVVLIQVSTLIGSFLVTLIMGWFFVGKLLQPINSIIQKVKTISPVEHSERLPLLTEKDEIAALVSTFNQLLDRLEDSFNLQQNFVANVSHEINNPLTKIKSQLEVSLLQNQSSEYYRMMMESVIEDVNELIKLIQDLLNFSRMPNERFIAHTPVRVDELLFDVREQIIQQTPAYQVNINLEDMPAGSEQLVFYCNKQLLGTALKNIFENGCKFSNDKTVTVKLSRVKGGIMISVSDNGPGISERELPFIFEPFYRSASMQQVKGYGIGLALAYRILRAHQFPLQVQSEVGKGTTFSIRFSN